MTRHEHACSKEYTSGDDLTAVKTDLPRLLLTWPFFLPPPYSIQYSSTHAQRCQKGLSYVWKPHFKVFSELEQRMKTDSPYSMFAIYIQVFWMKRGRYFPILQKKTLKIYENYLFGKVRTENEERTFHQLGFENVEILKTCLRFIQRFLIDKDSWVRRSFKTSTSFTDKCIVLSVVENMCRNSN